MKLSRYPTYNPLKDGNVFKWILAAAIVVREVRQVATHGKSKETAAKS